MVSLGPSEEGSTTSEKEKVMAYYTMYIHNYGPAESIIDSFKYATNYYKDEN